MRLIMADFERFQGYKDPLITEIIQKSKYTPGSKIAASYQMKPSWLGRQEYSFVAVPADREPVPLSSRRSRQHYTSYNPCEEIGLSGWQVCRLLGETDEQLRIRLFGNVEIVKVEDVEEDEWADEFEVEV